MRKYLMTVSVALTCLAWYVSVGAGDDQKPAENAKPADAKAGAATLVVKLPASATLKIGDFVSTQKGTTRTLFTPPLVPGYTYSYELVVSWTDAGQEKKATKTISFQANKTVEVDLTQLKVPDRVALKIDEPKPAEKTPAKVDEPKSKPAPKTIAKVDEPKTKPAEKSPAKADEPKSKPAPKTIAKVDEPKTKPAEKSPAKTDEPKSKPAPKTQGKIRVAIIDGQNNHNWRATTPVMKKSLEDSGRFTVDVITAPEKPKAPQKPKSDNPEDLAKYKELQAKQKTADEAYRTAMAKFVIPFEKYQVVVSNYNGESWPKTDETKLDGLLKDGKIGLVVVHAADNAFTGWKEYNLMIGMGWRNKKFGERLKIDDSGKEVRVPAGDDLDTGHRYSGPFKIIVRDPNHPITKGMPIEWMHAQDELYDNLRGPIENVHLLATGLAPKGKGTGVQEPMIFTIKYGKGRVFHTPMGHDVNGMHCVGFITTLQRGTEWAATGNVTLPLPANFPTADKVSSEAAK